MDKSRRKMLLPLEAVAEMAKPATGGNYGIVDMADVQLGIILLEMAHSGKWVPEIIQIKKRSERGTNKCHKSKTW